MSEHNILSKSTIKYRSDIDGLRGLSVLLVIGYHAFPNLLPGAFIGVDIFFVISGYLISMIIFKGMANNQFSLKTFYAKRIRRIFPSLLTVMIVGLLLGWFCLFDSEYRILGRHITAGTFFLSNLTLWLESGYFDNSTYKKPLLHLWSLSIEEQFYIIYPFLIYIFYKYKNKVFFGITGILVASFLFNIILTKSQIVTAFYSPISRFWELMIGALLAYYYTNKESINKKWTVIKTENIPQQLINIFSIIGIILFFIGSKYITKEALFPGWLALLPTIGALLIISSEKSWINQTVLSNKPLVWIGKISYPLYLWHWLLLSFSFIFTINNTGATLRIIIILISVLLSWLTLKYIENPFRFGSHSKRKTTILCFSMLIIGCIGITIYVNNGIKSRSIVKNTPFVSIDNEIESEKYLINDCNLNSNSPIFRHCFKDSREQPRFILIGDSKALSLIKELVDTSLPKGRWQFIGRVNNSAPIPLLYNEPSNNYVSEKEKILTKETLKNIINTPSIETVVIWSAARSLLKINKRKFESLSSSKNYPIVYEGLNQFVKQLVIANKQIIFIIDNPTLDDPLNCVNRFKKTPQLNDIFNISYPNPNCTITKKEHLKITNEYRNLISTIQSNYPNHFKIFDSTPYLCDSETNICNYKKDNKLLYSYGDHISSYIAKLIGTDLNYIVNNERI